MTLEIEGLSLEKLIREAPACGVRLRRVSRAGDRRISVSVSPADRAALLSLCARFGWEVREIRADAPVRLWRLIRRRWTLAAGLLLGMLLLALAEGTILLVDVQGAGENAAEVQRVLSKEGATSGRLKRAVSLDTLREKLMLGVPGLSYATLRYAGSVLEVKCQRETSGEQVEIGGETLDLIAERPGIITQLVVSSGTPQVEIGQAVCAGQVLVRGEERTEKGGMIPIQAQAQVKARVWAKGEARVSLYETKTRETGRTRTRVTVRTPWHERVVQDALPFEAQDALPFEAQDVSVRTQPVVGLYLPLWREIETYAEIEVQRSLKDRGDAASQAQGAAQEIAKKQCPADAEILDKWVDYSMIDNEFVYATVVLEYERDIAARAGGE